MNKMPETNSSTTPRQNMHTPSTKICESNSEISIFLFLKIIPNDFIKTQQTTNQPNKDLKLVNLQINQRKIDEPGLNLGRHS